jgi:hypothetical protein
LGGVDLVTVHGKLEWEALGRTRRIAKKKEAFFKRKESLEDRGIRRNRFAVV